jgi:hypothetical protein
MVTSHAVPVPMTSVTAPVAVISTSVSHSARPSTGESPPPTPPRFSANTTTVSSGKATSPTSSVATTIQPALSRENAERVADHARRKGSAVAWEPILDLGALNLG